MPFQLNSCHFNDFMSIPKLLIGKFVFLSYQTALENGALSATFFLSYNKGQKNLAAALPP